MTYYNRGSFSLDVSPRGVSYELFDEREGRGSRCTLEQFLAGTLHDEVTLSLGPATLESALKDARALHERGAKRKRALVEGSAWISVPMTQATANTPPHADVFAAKRSSR